MGIRASYRVGFLAGMLALFLSATALVAGAATAEVTLTGTVSCAHCQGIQPLHKGYTQWTWALHAVGEGDGIVFLVGDKTYDLLGERDQLLKYMSFKATVTGRLEGNTLEVQSIGRPTRKSNKEEESRVTGALPSQSNQDFNGGQSKF
jgi:hypothetical protein